MLLLILLLLLRLLLLLLIMLVVVVLLQNPHQLQAFLVSFVVEIVPMQPRWMDIPLLRRGLLRKLQHSVKDGQHRVTRLGIHQAGCAWLGSHFRVCVSVKEWLLA